MEQLESVSLELKFISHLLLLDFCLAFFLDNLGDLRGIQHHDLLQELLGCLVAHVNDVVLSPDVEQVPHDQVVAISGSDVHWSVPHVLSLLVAILTLTNHDPDHV